MKNKKKKLVLRSEDVIKQFYSLSEPAQAQNKSGSVRFRHANAYYKSELVAKAVIHSRRLAFLLSTPSSSPFHNPNYFNQTSKDALVKDALYFYVFRLDTTLNAHAVNIATYQNEIDTLQAKLGRAKRLYSYEYLSKQITQLSVELKAYANFFGLKIEVKALPPVDENKLQQLRAESNKQDDELRQQTIMSVTDSVRELLAETPQERHARADKLHRDRLAFQVSRLRNLGMADKCGNQGCENKPVGILLARITKRPELGIGEISSCEQHLNIGSRSNPVDDKYFNGMVSGSSTLSNLKYVN
jgi:hypothetical protein